MFTALLALLLTSTNPMGIPKFDPQVERLINRLEAVGKDRNVWQLGGEFLPVECTSETNRSDVHVDPTMRALSAMGARAVPQLLSHLTDSRPTELKIGFDKKYQFWLSFENSPSPVATISPPRPVFPPTAPTFRKYTFTVGDLCYVLVGDIVNRKLFLIRPTVGNITRVIISPTHNPELARKLREEWEGLTPEAHERSLVEDSEKDLAPAMVRLSYYYPAKAREIAKRYFGSYLQDPLKREKLIERANDTWSPTELARIREEGLRTQHFDAAVYECEQLSKQFQNPKEHSLYAHRFRSLFGAKKPSPDARGGGVDISQLHSLADALKYNTDPELDQACKDCFLRVQKDLRAKGDYERDIAALAEAFYERAQRRHTLVGVAEYKASLFRLRTR